MRVEVKDNIDTVGFIFSNGYQVISPRLKLVNQYMGLRSGVSDDGTIAVVADYDGDRYTINTYRKYILRRFTGGIVIDTKQTDSPGIITAFDCKKAK